LPSASGGNYDRSIVEDASSGEGAGADPRPAAVTFVTTEHFTLQGARASTIAESTGRATMFLAPSPAAWSRWD
jgi:hypothetical protein